jgi:hypothetical protein
MSGSIIGSYAHSTNIAIPEADTNDAKPLFAHGNFMIPALFLQRSGFLFQNQEIGRDNVDQIR